MDEQVRYRLPADVIRLVAAAADAERVHPSTIIERAVRSYFGAHAELAVAVKMIRESQIDMADIRDTLNVIADQSIDKSLVIAQLAEENDALKTSAPLT